MDEWSVRENSPVAMFMGDAEDKFDGALDTDAESRTFGKFHFHTIAAPAIEIYDAQYKIAKNLTIRGYATKYP